MEEFTPFFCDLELPDIAKQEFVLPETFNSIFDMSDEDKLQLPSITLEIREKRSKTVVLVEPEILYSRPYIYTVRVSIPYIMIETCRMDFELYYYHNEIFKFVENDTMEMLHYEITKRIDSPGFVILDYRVKFKTSSAKHNKSPFVLCFIATNKIDSKAQVLYTSRPFALLARKGNSTDDAYTVLLRKCEDLDNKLIKY